MFANMKFISHIEQDISRVRYPDQQYHIIAHVYQIGDTSNSLHYWFKQWNVLLLKWFSFLVSHKTNSLDNCSFICKVLYIPPPPAWVQGHLVRVSLHVAK